MILCRCTENKFFTLMRQYMCVQRVEDNILRNMDNKSWTFPHWIVKYRRISRKKNTYIFMTRINYSSQKNISPEFCITYHMRCQLTALSTRISKIFCTFCPSECNANFHNFCRVSCALKKVYPRKIHQETLLPSYTDFRFKQTLSPSFDF